MDTALRLVKTVYHPWPGHSHSDPLSARPSEHQERPNSLVSKKKKTNMTGSSSPAHPFLNFPYLCSPSFLCGNLKGIFHIPLSHEMCFQYIQDFHKFMLTAITYSHFSADTEFSSWVSRPTSSLTPSRSFSFQCHDAHRSVYVNFMPHPSRDPYASTSPPWLRGLQLPI